MVRKTVKYIDFNGNEAEDELFFNLNEVEIVELDLEFEGGLESFVENLDPEKNPKDVMMLFRVLMSASVGHKTEDGKHFIKDDDEAKMFKNSAAYSALFVEMIQDETKGAAFFNALLSANAPSA